jgi:hypothetical protein
VSAASPALVRHLLHLLSLVLVVVGVAWAASSSTALDLLPPL